MQYVKFLIFSILPLIMVSNTLADNLYQVTLTSKLHADILKQAEIIPVHRLHDSYLILAETSVAEDLSTTGLRIELVEPDIRLDEIFLSRPEQRGKALPGKTILEIGTERIIRTDLQTLSAQQLAMIVPLSRGKTKIMYEQGRDLNLRALSTEENLFDLISLVSKDSLISYLDTLVSYNRLTCTSSSWEASQWIKTKFESFGYDSVRFDYFTGSQLWDRVSCDSRNVIAVKPGSRFPGYQIVVGGHMDAVPDCPGADDDGSGTAGVLEIARILANVETEMTIVFCAFDSEESWMWGSYHYVDEAMAHGDNIVYMLNLDMIGYYKNTINVDLHHGSDLVFTELFSHLADSLVGLNAVLMGSVSASDHLPFAQAGIPVTFVIENFFSEYYHTPQDDITTLDFDYITKIVKAGLATSYSIVHSGLPVTTLAVYDVGDGQSLEIHWLSEDPSIIDHFEIVAIDQLTGGQHFASALSTETSSLLTGLTTMREYMVRVLATDTAGLESLIYNELPGTPRIYPLLPANQSANTIMNGVKLDWTASNTELDFDHYAVIRDGDLIADIGLDTSYLDMDPSLGSDLHLYLIVAVDADANMSDTTGANWMVMRAATLRANHILAINRSGSPREFCDSAITRAFLQEALTGLDYDYFADPYLFMTPAVSELVRLVDYEVVIIAAESGKGVDDLGSPMGLYEQLRDYLEIGGKVVIFGRWGDFGSAPGLYGTASYNTYPNILASQYFHLSGRTLPYTQMDFTNMTLVGDLIGGHSLYPEYPNLLWDSVATAAHGISFPLPPIHGIPCPSIPHLDEETVDVIYTYDSWSDSSITEGQPVAWRYLGSGHQYVCFDLPLSFMDRDFANIALRQAISDFGLDLLDDHDNDGVPNDSDNCRFAANFDQADSDGDGFGDACDVCEGYNDLIDGDNDGVPDGCDICPDFNDRLDNDGDGYADQCDNCPQTPNPDQTDTDQDGRGDLCDACCGMYTSGYSGNINCSSDGKRNLADIIRLIDKVYLSKLPLCCPENGNTNGDPEGKTNLADITKLIDHVYISKTETAACE